MAKEQNENYVLKESEDTLGTVKIADEVVATIAGLAAAEVKGVTSMAGAKKGLTKGVKIEVSQEEVRVALAINIAYGYNIPEISRAVRDRVKSAIETMTGLAVASVDIRIADVNFDNEK